MILLFLIIILFLFLEVSHYLKPSSPLKIKPQNWEIKVNHKQVDIKGSLIIENPDSSMEIMVPKFSINPTLIGNKSTSKLQPQIKIYPNHPDQSHRKDNYWSAYIVKSKNSTEVQVQLLVESTDNEQIDDILESIWLEIKWINYGPFGQIDRHDGLAIPIKKYNQEANNKQWIESVKGIKMLPIKTHILGRLDDPFQTLINYTSLISKPGDILTIGETPLAIMQGRYILPSTIKVSFLSRFLCSFFHPTSSLATGCGMQTLIDIQGPTRILFAWGIGALLKVLGFKGFFYVLAGNQARLIDDITGTTPPYDQTIVLGPIELKRFCTIASKRLGIHIAIVDVNDLGKVKILAASENCNHKLLHKALISNPAGNANEHTPLVLIRPSENTNKSYLSKI